MSSVHSHGSVPKLYQSVMEDVITSVREVFADEGIDEQVLQELKTIWESKLVQTKVLEPPPRSTTPSAHSLVVSGGDRRHMSAIVHPQFASMSNAAAKHIPQHPNGPPNQQPQTQTQSQPQQQQQYSSNTGLRVPIIQPIQGLPQGTSLGVALPTVLNPGQRVIIQQVPQQQSGAPIHTNPGPIRPVPIVRAVTAHQAPQKQAGIPSTAIQSRLSQPVPVQQQQGVITLSQIRQGYVPTKIQRVGSPDDICISTPGPGGGTTNLGNANLPQLDGMTALTTDAAVAVASVNDLCTSEKFPHPHAPQVSHHQSVLVGPMGSSAFGSSGQPPPLQQPPHNQQLSHPHQLSHSQHQQQQQHRQSAIKPGPLRPVARYEKRIPQLDGAGGISDDEDDDDDDEFIKIEDADDGVPPSEKEAADIDDDVEEAEEESVGEPLNSDDDISEEDPAELFEADNVVVCQYDKITRARNRWKLILKDGIMNLNGRDYVFQRASGEAEW